MAPTNRERPEAVPDRVTTWEALLQAPTSPRNGSMERYYDAGLHLARETTAQGLAREEIARLARQVAIVRVAGSIPRRLGAEAERQELSLDHKRAKRVAHALGQSLNAWTSKPRVDLNEEVIRREGAQLEWEVFAAEHRTAISTSLRVIATWAIRNDELRWGRSAVINLTNELAWMRYALRD